MQRMLRFDSLFNLMIVMMMLLGLVRKAKGDESMGIIGSIVDMSSRVGKEETVAMKMAFDDFYYYSNHSFVLHISDSHGDPLQAAIAARDLIDKRKVEVIIGPQTWEETSLVSKICSPKSIPFLSLADATPEWATEKWNYLVQASPSLFIQMKAIAAIVTSWKWHQVSIIYQDTDSYSIGIFPHLSRFLVQAKVEISNLLPIPPFVSSSFISAELQKLREGSCRVFLVHLSPPLALHVFKVAKKMKMMERDYVWITTDPFTSLVDSFNSSSISTMQGIIGVKRNFSDTGEQYDDFYLKFRKRFSSEHPEEQSHQPGIFAAQAYDAAWVVAQALREINSNNKDDQGGKVLKDRILTQKFTGLSGKVELFDQKLDAASTFQIINVIGKSYRELGFWSDGVGFWEMTGRNGSYGSSMKALGQVFWPGGPSYAPKGWTLSSSEKPLRIGVPTRSPLKQHVTVTLDHSDNTSSFTGFAIDVFKATLELLPFYLPYEFYAFNGTYEDMVRQIYLKKYDAVVGDVTILSRRYDLAEFTLPYTESGLVMIVPLRSKEGSKAWLFMKPFTKTMWVLIGAMIAYNGFVLWMIERNHSAEFKGSVLSQTCTMLCSALSTLISLHGDKLHSNLSRMTMVVWLFVALIITQTYTANLASMLTVERLEPTIDSVDKLRKMNSTVGYTRGASMRQYLQEVLHLHPEKLRNILSQDESAQALKFNEIAAFFLEFAEAKVFLAKHCRGFAQVGPIYKVGGFGFVFPKGSPLLYSVNKALLDVAESGQIRDLEIRMLASQECVEEDLSNGTTSLSPNSFWALFTFTGGTSSIGLLIYIFSMKNSIPRHKAIWKIIMAIMKKWESHKVRFSRRVYNNPEQNPTNSANTYHSPAQV